MTEKQADVKQENVKTEENVKQEDVKAQEEQAKKEFEERRRVQLEIDDMRAMGMTDEEIEAEMQKRAEAKKQEEAKKAEDSKSKDTTKEPAKAEENSTNTEQQKQKTADEILQEMLLAKQRAEKQKKLQEEAEKLKKEQEAAKNKVNAAEIQEQLKQKEIELFTLKQERALENMKNTIDKEEWNIIAPTLQELIESDYYDKLVLAGTEPEILIADLIAKAKGLNAEKLIDYRLQKEKKKLEAKETVQDIKNFNINKTQSVQKSELEILKEKALQGKQTPEEAERLIELLNARQT
jgi:hypothetical protein